MFDISFFEIFVIGAVALIVIGPERLPKVARTMGHLFGRMQRYVNDVKADISREMELEELKKLQNTMHDTMRSIETSVRTGVTETESQLNAQFNEIGATATEPATSAPAPDAPMPQLELGLERAAEPAARKQA